jgi:hypothetical protein
MTKYDVCFLIGRIASIEILFSLVLLLTGTIEPSPAWFMIQGAIFVIACTALISATVIALIGQWRYRKESK